MKLSFWKCEHCGNVIVFAHKTPVPLVCCGDPMKELTANTVDASKEKHVPVYSVEGDLVKINVGSVEHPMDAEHYIEFIAMETDHGYQLKYLNPGDKPFANFKLPANRHVKAIYAYCNKHGLWQANIK